MFIIKLSFTVLAINLSTAIFYKGFKLIFSLQSCVREGRFSSKSQLRAEFRGKNKLSNYFYNIPLYLNFRAKPHNNHCKAELFVKNTIRGIYHIYREITEYTLHFSRNREFIKQLCEILPNQTSYSLPNQTKSDLSCIELHF